MFLVVAVLAATLAPQLPSVEGLTARLTAGRLVLDRVRFQPNSDGLLPDVDSLLRQTARAINAAPGRFVVFVPSERGERLPPDTVLARRRRAAAFRALLQAGANPAHLLGLAEGASAGPQSLDSVPVGDARIELIRVDRPFP
ncbi:MAG: hypothetical protein AB7L66_07955 [Gemmatimonadales bacterium]